MQTADGQTQEVEGAYVEPVQLQVGCQELWARVPDNVELITPEHLEALADLDVVLGRFYEDALSAAAERARVRERRLRRWVWDELVTPGGTRSTVYRGPDASAGLPNAAVDVLEDKRLIRAEERAGAKWYELTHDRLIEPIRRSNERFSARRRRTLLKTAVALAPILLIGLPLGIGFGVGGGKSSSGGVVVPAALTPSGLDFGVIHDPRAAQDQSLILSSGSKDQRVSLHKSGDANDFVVDSGCGDKLKARKTCTITVLFSPTRLGKRVASVRIGDSTDLEAQLTGSLGGRCGIERWAVKTLTDPDAARVDLNPKPTTIADLVRLPIPANIGSSRAAPVELSTFRVRARLVAMKLEDDQDIHLVIADPATGATMVTEFPAAACIVGATPSFQEKMNAARGALVSRCGLPSGRLFTALRGTASLTGVGFFDRIHGQNGQAPNGIELHPVLAFSADCGTAALLPDLVISSYNFILRGRRIVGSVVVANVGAVESPRTSVEVVAPVPFVPARVPVPSLAPNKSFRARLILVRPVGRTATNVVVTVDPQGRVREQNDSNNARPVIIRLPPTPPPPPLPQPEPAPLPPPVTTIIGG